MVNIFVPLLLYSRASDRFVVRLHLPIVLKDDALVRVIIDLIAESFDADITWGGNDDCTATCDVCAEIVTAFVNAVQVSIAFATRLGTLHQPVRALVQRS